MNLNRAILPCPLDFPVAIASARRNNIHLTVCRAFHVCVCAAYPVRPTRHGPFPLHTSFGASCSTYCWYSPNPGEFRHSENSHFCRSSCTHSRPINPLRQPSRNSWKFSANRYDTRSCETLSAYVAEMTVFLFCPLFFLLFFSIETRFDQVALY